MVVTRCLWTAAVDELLRSLGKFIYLFVKYRYQLTTGRCRLVKAICGRTFLQCVFICAETMSISYGGWFQRTFVFQSRCYIYVKLTYLIMYLYIEIILPIASRSACILCRDLLKYTLTHKIFVVQTPLYILTDMPLHNLKNNRHRISGMKWYES